MRNHLRELEAREDEGNLLPNLMRSETSEEIAPVREAPLTQKPVN